MSPKVERDGTGTLNGFSKEIIRARKTELEKILSDGKSTQLSVDAVAQMIKDMISDINHNIDELSYVRVTRSFL